MSQPSSKQVTPLSTKEQNEAREKQVREKRANCPHTNIVKEYYGGMQTGDNVCKDCGETFER